MNDAAFANELYRYLAARADPAQAGPMSRYLLDQFPFFGIKATPLRKHLREFLIHNPMPLDADLESIARKLFACPEREAHHTALELLEKQAKRAPRSRIELYEELIAQNSWWDSVDHNVSRLIGPHLLRFPELVAEYNERWITSDNFWYRRVALTFQLLYKERTDTQVLFENCRRTLHEEEFFIRKAIGWALRQFSKSNPEAVAGFLTEHRTELSALSLKEGARWIRTNHPDLIGF